MRAAAQAAIAGLTGRPFASQPRTPVQVLTAAAWGEHRRRPEFPDEPTTIWAWDASRKALVPRDVPADEARTILGLRFAREALRLDPKDRPAQVAQLSLALEKAVERVKPDAVPAQGPATFSAATAAGPSLLGEVLETAIANGKSDLAAVAALALAKVTNRESLVSGGRTHPLVRALHGARTPGPVRRRPVTGRNGARPAIPRLEPGGSGPRPVPDEPAPTPRRGDRRQPQSGRGRRRLPDGSRVSPGEGADRQRGLPRRGRIRRRRVDPDQLRPVPGGLETHRYPGQPPGRRGAPPESPCTCTGPTI